MENIKETINRIATLAEIVRQMSLEVKIAIRDERANAGKTTLTKSGYKVVKQQVDQVNEILNNTIFNNIFMEDLNRVFELAPSSYPIGFNVIEKITDKE